MIFADPVWLWGILLLVPVLVFKMVNLATKNNKTSNFVAQNLKKLLVHGSNRKIKLIKYIVLSFAFSFILIAMARPQWGHEDQQSFSKGRTVMIAIDASRSMLAEDLTPNRLSRAKLAAYDLIDALPEDLIGLMAFSGSASVMVPITPDRGALKESIEQLDTYSVAKGGTNLGEAIKKANEVLIESDTDSHALVLFTDGENLDGDTIVEAKNARDKGTIIVTIGVGSEVGSIIPDDRSRKNQTNFIKDESGKLVKSKLDIETLTNIAETANGVFLRLDTNSINSEIINTTLDKLDTKETEFRDQKIPIERFGWPLGIGLFLIISVMSFDILHSIFMSKIKVLTIFIGFFSICLIEENSAGVISDAKDSFESGNYTEAVDLYQKAISESKSDLNKAKLNLGLGASAFKISNYEIATSAFGSALLSNESYIQEIAYYNLGNSLYRRGEKRLKTTSADNNENTLFKDVISDWEGAIEHYESAIRLNRNNTNAQHNLDVVRKKLEELKDKQNQENQDQENQGTKKIRTKKIRTKRIRTKRIRTKRIRTKRIRTKRIRTKKIRTKRIRTKRIRTKKIRTKKIRTKRIRTKKIRTKRIRTKRIRTKRIRTKRIRTKRIRTKRIRTKRIRTKRIRTKKTKKLTQRQGILKNKHKDNSKF